jgi:hypothetical protein
VAVSNHRYLSTDIYLMTSLTDFSFALEDSPRTNVFFQKINGVINLQIFVTGGKNEERASEKIFQKIHSPSESTEDERLQI